MIQIFFWIFWKKFHTVFYFLILPLYFWYNTEAWTGVTTCCRGPILGGDGSGGDSCSCCCREGVIEEHGTRQTEPVGIGCRVVGRWGREFWVGGGIDIGGENSGSRRQRRRGGGDNGDGGSGGDDGSVTELTRRHVALTRLRYAPATVQRL